MQRDLSVFIAFSFLCTLSFAQEPVTEWQKVYDTFGNSTFFNVQKTPDNGFLLSGCYDMSGGNYENGRIAAQAEVAAMFYKTDSAGNRLWHYITLPGGISNFYNVVQTPAGKFIGGGYFSTNIGVQGDVLLEQTSGPGFGALEWSKKLGGSLNDKAFDLKLTNDGGLIFAGYAFSTDGNVTGNHGNGDMWIGKCDLSGNLLWQKCLGGTGNDTAYNIIPLVDGSYVVAGTTSSNDGTVTSNAGNADAWLVKIDATGSVVWQKTFGGSGDEGFKQLQATGDGGLIAVGYTNSNDGIVTNNHGNADVWVVKCDNSGNLQWQKCYGGSMEDKGSDIKPVDGGGYIINSFSFSSDGDVHNNYGSGDQWVIKIMDNGVIEWAKSIGTTSSEVSTAVLPLNQYQFLALSNRIKGSKEYSVLTKLGSLNAIEGTLFIDVNANGTKDADEPFFNNATVKTIGADGYTRSSGITSGGYSNAVKAGTYETSVNFLNAYYTVEPQSYTSNFDGHYGHDQVNFRLVPVANISDMQVSLLPLGTARPGFTPAYKINYKNVGTTALSNLSIEFNKDASCSIISTHPAYQSATGNTLTWNISNLPVMGEGSIYVTLQVPPPPTVNNGDTLKFSVLATHQLTDNTPDDNADTLLQVTKGSFDPNDKTESHGGIVSPAQIAGTDPFTYLIRFQNTGTDTAFDITVRDTLDTRLDWNSLQMITASHTYQLSIEDGNKLTWQFTNIKLPYTGIDETNSHGYIAYRIKPKSTLQSGDKIYNSASIYFDLNRPVQTNNHETVIEKTPVPPSPVPVVSGLQLNYCGNLGAQKAKLLNLPAATSGITVTAKLDATVLIIGADSTVSFTVFALTTGPHNLTVTYSNVTDTKTFATGFTVIAAAAPDVNLTANITNVVNLANPVVVTASNASGGGKNPLYTFAWNNSFTNIAQAESSNNILNITASSLALGDNKAYVKMKTSEDCYTVQTNIDSITIRRDISTGITDADNPGQVITVYPNPVKGPITIKGLSIGKAYIFTIKNLQGQMIFTKRVANQNTTTITGFKGAAGTYWLTIYDDKNSRALGSVQLIKQ